MNYFLATTGLSNIWDMNKDLLLIGPWCIASQSNRSLLKGKKYTLIPSPWKPATRVKAAADYCHNIYEELLPILAGKLNTLHGVDYPDRYWRVLTGYWLFIFVSQVYCIYKRVVHANELFPEFFTSVLPKEQCNLVSLNALDAVDNINNDYFNLKLFSLIFISLFPDKVSITPYHDKVERKQIRYSRIHNLVNKMIQRMSSGNIVLSELYHVSLENIFTLAWKSRFKAFTFMDFEPELGEGTHEDYSPEMRSGLELPSSSDPFGMLLSTLIPNAIPMSYVEHYHAYKSSMNDKRKNVPQIVGSAGGWLFNDRFKFFAADAVANGARIIEFQHGGGYGLSLSIPNEEISTEKDVFFSWGWKTENIDNIRPIPSPYLSSLKNSHSQEINNIVFVGTSVPLYDFRFDSALFPDDIYKYFNDKMFFLSSLSEEIRQSILYKPGYTEYGWGDKRFVSGIYPDIVFIEKGRLIHWLQKAKLAVFDNAHTSYIEALTINVPTVLYWDHDIYLMRPEAEEFFELLRAAGILHRSPEDAAKKINEISEYPLSWWRQPDIQEARTEFCDRFALAREDWADEWVRTLKSL